MLNQEIKFTLLNKQMMKQFLQRGKGKKFGKEIPHHGIPYCIQLETFYNDLNTSARQMLDATAGGAFTASTYN